MTLKEQKEKLLKMVQEADEETIAQLLKLVEEIHQVYIPLSEEVAKYEKRSQEFITSGEKGLSKEESLELLRKGLK